MGSDSKQQLFFLIGGAVLLLALLPFLLEKPFTTEIVDDASKYAWCADRLGDIHQGEPYCGESVIAYATLKLIRFLSGGAFSAPIYILILLLVNLHALYLIQRIVRKETGKNEYLLILSLYAVLIYLFSYNFSSTFAMYYVLLGFTIMFYYSFKWHTIIGPAIMALGPLTKATSMPLFGLLVLYMAYKSYQPKFVNGKFSFNRKIFHASIPFISIAAVFSLVFLVIWPKAYAYAYGLQGSRVNLPFIEMGKMMVEQFTINSGTVFVGLLLILSIVAWIFLRDVYSGATVLFVMALFTILFRQTGLGSDNGLQFAINRIDYYLSCYPFFIVAMAKLKHKIPWRIAKICFGILLVIFLATTIEFTVSEHDTYVIEEHFKKGLGLIPAREGDVVLTEDPNSGKFLIDTYYDSDIKMDVIPHDKVWKHGIFPDGNFLEQLIILNMTTRAEWMDPPDQAEYQRLFNRVLNNTYSIIFFNTPQFLLINQFVLQAPNIREYCMVRLPDLQFRTVDGLHELVLLFNERQRCSDMMPKVQKYYDESFSMICDKSPYAANQIVKNTLAGQDIALEQECNKEPDSILFLNRGNYHTRWFSSGLALALVIFLWLGFGILRFRRRA